MNKDQSTAVMERDVRELSLGDMLIQVFRHWKAIIIVAIIGALVFTGFSCYIGVSGPRVWAAQRAAAEAAGQPVSIDEATQARIDGMSQLRAHFQDVAVSQSEYIQNSIVMQMDPYAVNRTTVVMWLTSDDESITRTQLDAFITLYADVAVSQEILEPIAEEFGIPYWALREVVGVGTDFDRDRIWYNVSFTDSDGAMAIAQRIADALMDLNDDYSAQFGDHDLAVASMQSRVQVDTTYLDAQNTAWTYVHNNNTAIEKVGDDIDDISPGSPSSIIPRYRSLPMDIGIGAAIGFVVCFVVLCLAYLGSDKLRSDDEIRRMAPVRVWANNIAPQGHTGSTLALDKLQGMTPWKEGAYQRFADIFAPELEGKNSLLLVTTLAEDKIADIAAELENALNVKFGGGAVSAEGGSEEAASEADLSDNAVIEAEKPAFKVNICAKVSDSYTAVEAIRGAEAVLAVERAHTSSLKKGRAELELLSHVREDAMGVMVSGI